MSEILLSVSQLDDKSRILIPKKIRDSVGMNPNISVIVYQFGDYVLLKQPKAMPKQELKRIVDELNSRLGGEVG